MAGVAAACGIATQYGLGLLWAGVSLVGLARPSARRGWLLAQLPVGAMAAFLWAGPLSRQLGFGAIGTTQRSLYLAHGYWDSQLAGLLPFFSSRLHDLAGFAFPAGGLVVFLVLLDLLTDCRRRALLLVPLGLTALTALLGLYPLLGGRQSMHLVPLILVCAAAGLVGLRRPGSRACPLVVGACLLLLIGGGRCLERRATRGPDDLRPLVELVAALRQPEDAVWVYYGAAPAFRYYTRAEAWPGALVGAPSRGRIQGYLDELAPLLRRPGRTWLLWSHIYGDEREQVLRRVFRRRSVQEYRRREGAWLDLVE